MAAPWYAENIAETGPNETHLTDTIIVDGEQVDVISPGGTEIRIPRRASS